MRATGTFEVKFEPLESADGVLGRMRVLKTFRGDLTGSAQAEMLSVGTAVEGSAVYVAIDRVEGVLDGRAGSFVLHHNGVMRRGEGSLSVVVVPDSGTDQLTGIDGTLSIDVVDGVHHYTLDYQLA